MRSHHAVAIPEEGVDAGQVDLGVHEVAKVEHRLGQARHGAELGIDLSDALVGMVEVTHILAHTVVTAGRIPGQCNRKQPAPCHSEVPHASEVLAGACHAERKARELILQRLCRTVC